MKIAVSFLKSNYNLEETIKRIEVTKADYIHVDLTDGEYVKDNNLALISNLRIYQKPLDIHLMVKKPLKIIPQLLRLKPINISVHLDILDDLKVVSNLLQAQGIKMGIVLKLDQPVKMLYPYLEMIDQVLLMSVIAGKGGQPFNPKVLEKIQKLKILKEQNNYHYIISVDGGINAETIKKVKDVDLVMVGSYVCCSDNFDKKIESLK